MKDRAGNNLIQGDRVLYLTPGRSSSWLTWGIVAGFTPKMIVIQNADNMNTMVRKLPSSVVKPFQEW